MRFRSSLFAFCLAAAGAVFGPAIPALAEQVRIVAVEIEGLHQRDGQGLYDRIIAEAAADLDFKIDVLPPARALKEFETCVDCCLTPANTNPEFYPYGDGYLETDPMTLAQIFIWVAPGQAPIGDLAALQGKTVGARQGMAYGSTIENSGIDLDMAKSIEVNIKKVQGGRLDAFLAYVPDAYTAFDSLGIEPFPIVADNPVAEHPDNLLCRASGATEGFVPLFNQRLNDMLESGRIDELSVS